MTKLDDFVFLILEINSFFRGIKLFGTHLKNKKQGKSIFLFVNQGQLSKMIPTEVSDYARRNLCKSYILSAHIMNPAEHGTLPSLTSPCTAKSGYGPNLAPTVVK